MKSSGSYQLLFPPQVRFGWGARDQLGELLKQILPLKPSPRLFVVASRTFADTVIATFAGKVNCVICGVFTGVPHDPPLRTVDELICEIRSSSADAVLAVGGGSVMDAAKAAAVLAPIAQAQVQPYFDGQKIPGPGLPFIAVPTTAGTGTEITKNSVLTDEKTKLKKSLRSPYMVPVAAIVDPELTLSMPPDITAASGLDALTQAIESYLSVNANTVSSVLATQAVLHLMTGLPKAYHEGTDRTARSQVAEGSMLAGLAFSQSGLGAVHGLAHPLGALLDLPHGLTCAVLLPHVLAWNAPACVRRCDALAASLGLKTADNFLAAVAELCHELGVPHGFKQFGLKKTHFAHIVANCRSGSMKCNPRPMSDEDVRMMLTRLKNQ